MDFRAIIQHVRPIRPRVPEQRNPLLLTQFTCKYGSLYCNWYKFGN
jgi:hypothetical protein